MIIEHIFDTITLILNKNRRGFVKTSQKSTAVTAAMYEFFDSEVEIYRKTGFIPESIKKFVKTLPLTLTSGVSNLPSDFVQEVTFDTDCGSQGTFLTQEEYLDRVNSTILDPDQENPIAKIQNGQIIVAPDEFTTINLVYIRIPTAFVYATTLSGDSRSESFNSGGSTDIEFGYAYTGDIIRRALAFLGVAFQNNEALQVAINDNQK